MALNDTERHLYMLDEIRVRLDAINCAVLGADMNDSVQQKGISAFCGDVWCRIDDLIKDIKGEEVD
jgi:ABC-type transport system involved in cytochrome c biogenesis ATPase subunit